MPRKVALLAEGVDRNWAAMNMMYSDYVALLAEGVDRNNYEGTLREFLQQSPSSRRAWIEMA